MSIAAPAGSGTGRQPDDRPTVAVVGAGVSGLTAAYLLREDHRVTLFEREDRLGGHAHTHDVVTGDTMASVDSGFIVLNDRTYPRLHRLFGELGVTVQHTEMSMGVSCDGCGLGYVGGRGAAGIFAQKRRLLDVRFWRLLLGVRRFQRLALQLLEEQPDSAETYGEFLRRHRFSRHFVAHYALPVVSCVWSSGHDDALAYPAAYLFEFLAHHGFLSLGDAPEWYVVQGGSRAYVDRLRALLPEVLTSKAVSSVIRADDGVVVTDSAGQRRSFDRVVIASHADEALGLLGDPTEDEKEVLGAFGYTANATQLHRDDSVLPDRVAERASWNFRLADCGDHSDAVQVSYWMNRLQGHPAEHPLVVTLNGAPSVDPAQVLATMEYTHPLFTSESVRAQQRLPSLNSATTAYAGAYHGWGFHEDGCRSGIAAAAHFGSTW